LAAGRVFGSEVNFETTGVNDTKINIVTIAPFESKVKRADLSTILLDLIFGLLGLRFLDLHLGLKPSHFIGSVKLYKL
jgi:hypothetical protein